MDAGRPVCGQGQRLHEVVSVGILPRVDPYADEGGNGGRGGIGARSRLGWRVRFPAADKQEAEQGNANEDVFHGSLLFIVPQSIGLAFRRFLPEMR